VGHSIFVILHCRKTVSGSGRAGWLASVVFSCIALSGCITYSPHPEEQSRAAGRVKSLESDGIRVSSVVLRDEEAAAVYGAPLGRLGVRAIWLRIENDTDQQLHLLPSSLDQEFFSRNEAAYRFHSIFRPGLNRKISEHFRDLAIKVEIGPRGHEEGYLLVNRHRGGRHLPVELLAHQSLRRFDFFFSLPDGTFDFEDVPVEHLYDGKHIRALNRPQLRTWAEALPCCTNNRAGTAAGDPVNVLIVAAPDVLLGALARSGWAFTEHTRPKTVVESIQSMLLGRPEWHFPVSHLYLFARHQDLAMQRPRGSIPQRNHMRIWRAPVSHDGKPVWAIQLSRDIGIKPTWHSPFLLTHVIDPEVDEDRAYLLELLLRSQSVHAWGYVDGVGQSTSDAPASNLTGDPYVTDGRRLVIELSEHPVAIAEARYITW